MSQVITDKVLHLNNESFDQALRAELPVVVDFWAAWCGPCRMLGPSMEQLAQNYSGRAVVAKVNTDENQELAYQYGISSIPNVKIFKQGKEVENIVGAVPYEHLQEALERHL